MMDFFGLEKYSNGEYQFIREAEGAWSWQHLSFVGFLMATMIFLSIYIGTRTGKRSYNSKNKVLMVCAFLIDGFELVKIIVICIRCQNPFQWLYILPLFLCSIQLIAIPLAAFSSGRIKEAALDFVLIFGILGAIFGTIGATQNYNAYPVLSVDNVFSGITHSISGFASLYIAISGMSSMKKKNFPITIVILLSFSVAAYIANLILDYNYMFLMRDDGTPYSIFYNLVGGNPILYPFIVVALFIVYIFLFYWIYYLIQGKRSSSEKEQASAKEVVTVL